MAKKNSINLTVAEQVIIQDRLGQIWKNAHNRKVASLIGEIHLAIWPKASFGEFEWAGFSEAQPLKKAKPLDFTEAEEDEAEEAEETEDGEEENDG